MTFIGLVILIIFIVLAGFSLANLQESVNEKKQEADSLSKISERLKKRNEDLKENYKDLRLTALDAFGWKREELDTINLDVNQRVQEAFNANRELKKMIFEEKFNHRIHNFAITYYVKVKDEKKVQNALIDYGYDIKLGTSSERVPKTNVIVYSDDVDKNHIKFITLLLIRAGFEMKVIEKSNFLNQHIGIMGQIGYETNTKKPITVEQIIKLAF
jgi:hypothetical protein